MTVTVHELAKHFGIGIRRIEQLEKTGIFPKTERGRFNLAVCTRLYIRHLKTWKAPAEIPVSVADLARCLMVSQPTITALVSVGILPKIGHGQYDLVACTRAYIQHLNLNGQLSLLKGERT